MSEGVSVSTLSMITPISDSEIYYPHTYNNKIYLNRDTSVYQFDPETNSFTNCYARSTAIESRDRFGFGHYLFGYTSVYHRGINMVVYDIDTATETTYTLISNSDFQCSTVKFFIKDNSVHCLIYYTVGWATFSEYAYEYVFNEESTSWSSTSTTFTTSTGIPNPGQVADNYVFGMCGTTRNGIRSISSVYSFCTNYASMGTWKSPFCYGAFSGTDALYIVTDSRVYKYQKGLNKFSDDGVAIPTRSSYAVATYNDKHYLFYSDKIILLELVDYNLTYLLKDSAGTVTYKTLTGCAPLTKVKFNYTGSGDVSYVLTTISDTIVGTYTPTIPTAYDLTGITDAPKSKMPIAEFNQETALNVTTDFIFYDICEFLNPIEKNVLMHPVANGQIDETTNFYPKTKITNVLGLSEALGGKQETLVTGTNLKSVNLGSLLGTGDLAVGNVTFGAPSNLNLETISNQKGSASYGFVYSTSWTSYFPEGLVPQNRSTNSSYAYAKLTFTADYPGDLTVYYYQGSEANFDYGLISTLDSMLSYSTSADTTNVALNAKGFSGSGSITLSNMTAGEHFITVKYIKDSGQHTSPDLFAITKMTVPGTTALYNLQNYHDDTKQNLLTAGNGITITDNTISTSINYAEVFTITPTLSHVVADVSNAKEILSNDTVNLIFTASEGYTLPDSVSVSGATSTWTQSTGTLVLSNATSNVTFSIEGIEQI